MAKIVVDFGADIPGESTVTGYENKVDATGIQHDILFSVSWDGQTRSRGSESEHGSVVLTRNVDIASPKLYRACSNGNILNQTSNATVKIVIFKEGAEYLVISLRDVIVTQVENETVTIVDPKTNSKEERLVERVSLNYTAIHWNRGSVQGAWDLNLGSESYAPSA